MKRTFPASQLFRWKLGAFAGERDEHFIEETTLPSSDSWNFRRRVIFKTLDDGKLWAIEVEHSGDTDYDELADGGTIEAIEVYETQLIATVYKPIIGSTPARVGATSKTEVRFLENLLLDVVVGLTVSERRRLHGLTEWHEANRVRLFADDEYALRAQAVHDYKSKQ